MLITGVNHDTLLTVGWLDLRKGAQILRVPEMAGRYYSVQFNDPSKNANFAYVGKRTAGTGAGDLPAAYELAKQIQIAPLASRHPSD